MLHRIKLKEPIGSSYTMEPDDILNTKTALNSLGRYRVPDHGLNPYADRQLVDGLKSFQRDQGLQADGVMKPDGPTASVLGELMTRQSRRPTLREQFQKIKKRGARKSLLDSSDDDTPNEPPEDDDPEKPDDKPDQPDEPDKPKKPKDPKPSCISEMLVLRKIVEKIRAVSARVSDLENRLIHNLKLDIEKDKAEIAYLKKAELAAQFGGLLTRSPKAAAKIIGYVSELGGVLSGRSLQEIEADLAMNIIQLKEYEDELPLLMDELKNLKVEEAAARKKLEQCRAGGGS